MIYTNEGTRDLDEVSLLSILSQDEFELKLRGIHLRGDPKVYPYASAKISFESVEIERLSPLSRYYLAHRLDFQSKLRTRFLSAYDLDTLSLNQLIEYSYQRTGYRLSPPIVEVYEETIGDHLGETWALVDGLHRCMLARALGFHDIHAVVIQNVPKNLPLMALPLDWKDVGCVDSIPQNFIKRKLRYQTPEDCPNVHPFSDVQIDHSNFVYFFYRDLGPLGSDGPREPEEVE